MKFLRNLFYSLLTVFFILTAAGLILALVYEDEIEQLFVKEVNKHLRTEVSVGDMKLSLLRKLPHASLEFKNVSARSAAALNRNEFSDIQADTLLKAAHLYVQFNMKKLLKKQFHIENVQLQEGFLNLLADTGGQESYAIWEKRSATDSGSLQLSLEDLQLKDMQLNVINHTNQMVFKGSVRNGQVAGVARKSQMHIQTKAKLQIHAFEMQGTSIATNKAADLDFFGRYADGKISLSRGNLLVDELTFALSGDLYPRERKLNIRLTGKDMSLPVLTNLLPPDIQKHIAPYSPVGILDFETAITGSFELFHNPHLEARFSLTNGTITYRPRQIKLEKLHFRGSFTNGQENHPRSSRLDLQQLEAQIGSSRIRASFQLENLIKPLVKLDFGGEMRLEEIHAFYPLPGLLEAEGVLRTNIRFEGHLPEKNKPWTSAELQQLNPTGNFTFQTARLLPESRLSEIQDIRGNLMLGKHLWFDGFSLVYRKQKILLNGKVENLYAFLQDPDALIRVDADLWSDYVCVDSLINLYPNTVPRTGNAQGREKPNLELNLRLDIDELDYGNFHASRLTGLMNYKTGLLRLHSLSMQTQGGRLTGNGMAMKRIDQTYLFRLHSRLDGIDLSSTFHTFGQFGQDQLTGDMLEGTLNGNLELYAETDDRMQIQIPSLAAEGHVLIRNGRLKGFEPIQKLSSFVAVEELEDIRFSDLENDFFIRDEKLSLPQMDINSSALNITLSGDHYFNKNFNYSIKLLLSEVLAGKARKARRENSEFGRIEDDGLGRTSLYLKIIGKEGETTVSYDTESVGKMLKQNLQEEKSNLKNLFREEFGWYQGDSLQPPPQAEKKNRFQISWEEADSSRIQKADTSKKKKFKISFEETEKKKKDPAGKN